MKPVKPVKPVKPANQVNRAGRANRQQATDLRPRRRAPTTPGLFAEFGHERAAHELC